MHMLKDIGVQKMVRVVVWLLAPMLVFGCGGAVQEGHPLASGVMGSAPLPVYRSGTIYVYSDGTWEQVENVRDGKVFWVDYRGRRSAGRADFSYAREIWESTERQGTRRFVQDQGLFAGSPTGLWPLMEGNRTSFSEFTTSFLKENPTFVKESDNYWRCSVGGAETVSVSLGEFDSWQISCTRYSDNSAKARKRPREYRTWYYAPEIGHWLLERRDYTSRTKEDRRKELVAVMPDLTAWSSDKNTIMAMKRNFQQALENLSSGKGERFARANEQLTVTTTPVKTFRHEAGNICRQYQQRIAKAGDEVTYFGMACRDNAGVWKIPRRNA